LGPMDGEVRASLYRVATILSDEVDDEGGWLMRVQGSPETLRFLEPRFGSVPPLFGESDADIEAHAA